MRIHQKLLTIFLLIVGTLLFLEGCRLPSQEEELWEPVSRRIVWKRYQIPVIVDVSNVSPKFRAQAYQALESFNERVDCTVVVSGRENARIHVLDVGYSVGEDKVDEMTSVDLLGTEYQTAAISLKGAVTPTLTYLLTYHGLGHSFGLAHDTRGSSVMRPDVGDWEAEIAFSKPGQNFNPSMDNYVVPVPPRLSDRHAGVLHDKYCER